MSGFTALNVKIHNVGDPPVWPDVKNIVPVQSFETVVIEKGMASGKPAVGILVRLVNGENAVIETSGALIVAMARLIEARFPDVNDPETDAVPVPGNETKN
jgi:hypothetical protein